MYRYGLPVVLLILSACGSPGWTDDAIKQAEGDIRTMYEKKGLKVVDVALIRQSQNPYELTGYANLKDGKFQIQFACSAKMDSQGGRYIVSCSSFPSL